jgi:hypothetical protein
MNKLTKVGCSALCGSLAAISAAQAGSLTVTGGADMTWISKGGDVTGNPIGMGSNTSLKGSGELDNGWTFDLTIANANLQAFSTAAINLSMGGLGSLNFNQGDSGNGIQAMDDKMPTAWEEAWGAGLSTGVRLVSGVGTSQNIQYTSPTVGGTTFVVAYAPAMGAADVNDKATSDPENSKDSGVDVTINVNPSLGTEILSGLNLFVGGHQTKVEAGGSIEEDMYQAVGGVTYDLGPISLGWMRAGEYTGQDAGATANFHTYKNTAYGIAFNVNDDLSVSYGKMENEKAGYNKSSIAEGAIERELTVESWQVAYTMGGASVRIADIKADNVLWGANAGDDKKATVVSLGLAF